MLRIPRSRIFPPTRGDTRQAFPHFPLQFVFVYLPFSFSHDFCIVISAAKLFFPAVKCCGRDIKCLAQLSESMPFLLVCGCSFYKIYAICHALIVGIHYRNLTQITIYKKFMYCSLSGTVRKKREWESKEANEPARKGKYSDML
jgi:hypothetical protein